MKTIKPSFSILFFTIRDTLLAHDVCTKLASTTMGAGISIAFLSFNISEWCFDHRFEKEQ